MVRQRYIGLSNPAQAFKELMPYYERLQAMARTYPPSSAEFHALSHAHLTLRTAAELITKEPYGRSVGSSDMGCIGTGHRS